MLDNDFRNPDLDRYIGRFERYAPSIGILGDAYNVEEAREYNHAARELKPKFPDTELIVVPKCREAIDAVDGHHASGRGLEDAIVIEYENGRTLAYRDEHERDRIEYREGLTPVDETSP
jgi:hypothetical protein